MKQYCNTYYNMNYNIYCNIYIMLRGIFRIETICNHFAEYCQNIKTINNVIN